MRGLAVKIHRLEVIQFGGQPRRCQTATRVRFAYWQTAWRRSILHSSATLEKLCACHHQRSESHVIVLLDDARGLIDTSTQARGTRITPHIDCCQRALGRLSGWPLRAIVTSHMGGSWKVAEHTKREERWGLVPLFGARGVATTGDGISGTFLQIPGPPSFCPVQSRTFAQTLSYDYRGVFSRLCHSEYKETALPYSTAAETSMHKRKTKETTCIA